MNVSLLAGLKNNLEYSKNFYHSTRAIYKEVEIVFVSYNSNDGTNEWLDSLRDSNVICFYSDEEKTLSDTFNKCTELATKEIAIFVHNDMVLAPGFIENIEKHCTDRSVVCYTTVEPSIFAKDERPGKVIKDLGNDLSSFDIASFYNFAKDYVIEHAGAYDDRHGGTFFLGVRRSILVAIGGLDPIFKPMFREDDDLLLRLKLYGMTVITSFDAVCYHFVSKTSRFSEEYKNKTERIELNSDRNFIRKWGFSAFSSVKKRYNIGLVLRHGTDDLLLKLEPWFTSVYTDFSSNNYILEEQELTSVNLKDKIKPYHHAKTNDVLVYIDGLKFTKRAYDKIKMLPELIDHQLHHKTISFFDRLIGKNERKIRWKMIKIDILNDQSYEGELINNSRRLI
ncbi:glycosyltransferase [Pedobacter sp. MC2016-14]|uniref:glycosyltransferase family 2 protein n=1 Tax=Pedobacter sp. MC2016-14 TaxID=2897327 RepID=UPI001E3F412D|nr:glycosyltransferase [Pedobacter sp. MC2016-14]MCD0487105.1 glycosyltransferase [Pedobacter sp. MC2016-14]